VSVPCMLETVLVRPVSVPCMFDMAVVRPDAPVWMFASEVEMLVKFPSRSFWTVEKSVVMVRSSRSNQRNPTSL
jgi:hypothetical protein